MLIKSETTLRIIVLSFVTIASSSTPTIDSRPQSRRYLGNGPTIPTSKIGANRRVCAMPRAIEASSPIDRSARRIFFWPWRPRWHPHRWWHRRPFGFGAGIYGGIGIGVGPGAGLGFHRPVHVPGFDGTPGVGVGLGAGIGGGYRPGVGIGVGAGAAVGAGIVPSPPIYDQYQPEVASTIADNGGSNRPYSKPDRQPVNYPDLPPIATDFDGQPPISSNGADFSGPSAVGFDDGAEHSVGYDRTVRDSVRYKNQPYPKHSSDSNYDIDRGGTQQNGSYMTIGDTNKKRILQRFRDRHKKVPNGQAEYEANQNYFKGPENNYYDRDYEGEEQERYYDEDRYHDYPVVEQPFFTDRDLPRVNDAV